MDRKRRESNFDPFLGGRSERGERQRVCLILNYDRAREGKFDWQEHWELAWGE